jgi:hypothetical protein
MSSDRHPREQRPGLMQRFSRLNLHTNQLCPRTASTVPRTLKLRRYYLL